MTLGSATPITDPDRIRAASTWGALARHFDTVDGVRRDKPSKPYRQIPVVRRVVSSKAKMLGSLPLRISTADDRIVETGPLIDLIDCPNERMGRVDFWQTTSAWLDLSGACHWVFTKMHLGRPTEIVPVSAWQMKPVLDRRTAKLIKWRYRPAGTSWADAIDVMPDEVWTVGEDAFDPDHPFGYSSPLEAAGMAISQVFKSDMANESSLDNGVEPGGVFTMPGTPGDKQLKDARNQINERRGVRNRRRHLVLYGGMSWQTMAANFKDMEFSTLLRMKQIDICLVLDVDPGAFNIIEGGRQEFTKEAKKSLWTDTIMTRADWLADEFRRGIVDKYKTTRAIKHTQALKRARPMRTAQTASVAYQSAREKVASGGPGLTAWFDASRVPAIREMQLDLLKGGAILIKDYKQPPADVLDLLDIGVQTHEHQRHGWQNTSEMPVDDPIPGSDDPTDPPPPPPEVASEDEPDDGGGTGSDGEKSLSLVERELDEDALARIQQNWRNSWAGLEKQVKKAVDTHVKRLRKITLQNLDRVAGKRSISADAARDLIGEILFNLTEANGKLLVKVGPLVRSSYILGGQQSMDEAALAEGKPASEAAKFNIRDEEVARAMRRRNIKVTETNRTTRRALARSLTEGIEAGETTAQLAERIRKQFNLAGGRAATIARTEVGAAVEESRHHGRQQARVPLKSWLWSRRQDGRGDHQATEKQTLKTPIPNVQDFVVSGSGSTGPHPRATGVPGDDINCGCTTLARYPGDGVKDLRMLRHLMTSGFTGMKQLVDRGMLEQETDR